MKRYTIGTIKWCLSQKISHDLVEWQDCIEGSNGLLLVVFLMFFIIPGKARLYYPSLFVFERLVRSLLQAPSPTVR